MGSIHHLSLGQGAAAPTPAPGDEVGSGPRTPAAPSTQSASSAVPHQYLQVACSWHPVPGASF